MTALKKSMFTLLIVLSAAFVFAGCSNKDAAREDATFGEVTEEREDGKTDSTRADENVSHDEESMKDDVENAADDVGDAAEDVAEGVGDAAKDVAEGVGDAVKDTVDGAGEAVDDVADGVGDAIDNLGGGSFDSYDEAKKYLLDKLKKDNAGASYEVREETKDLTAYNSNDSGAEGYRFSVYETDGGEKIGIYYVDKDTGKIYRYMGKNSIEAY